MNLLGKLFSWHSLRTRISLALVGLTLALGIVALIQAMIDLTAILEERLQNRGIAIARDLAASSASPSQTNDVFGLYQVVNDSLLNNEDVRYIFLLEPSDEIRVHTFEDGVPPALAGSNRWSPGELQSLRRLKTNEGTVLDIAVPVLEGRGGIIRVGMSESGLRTRVVSYIARLALLVGVAVLGALALSFAVSSLLTRPLSRVAEAARRVGGGDLNTTVPVDPGNELGDLARAFNSMTKDLLRSRESLVQRNAELEILNSMADTLSRHLGRQQMLDISLTRLLELTGLSAAWVCVVGPSGRLGLAAHRGLSSPVLDRLKGYPKEGCPCLEALRTGRGLGVQYHPTCPLVADGSQNGEGIRSHAVVPLWSQGNIVGALSVASSEADGFNEARMRLLTSIGQQMSIAMENATLYEELERKERIRAELLEKVIGAQEEERKRIAREIHDEPVQELSGVILQLNQVERWLTGQKEAEPQDIDIGVVRQGVRVAMESLHRITTELRPQALDDLGFVPAIRWYAQQRLGDRGINVDLKVSGHPNRLPPPIEVAVFRIMQEAINNVAKHAEAANIYLRLGFGDALISGDIVDDGKGFDLYAATETPGDRARLGLMGMHERAVLLGGNLSVTSSPGQGTRVSFEIPLPGRRIGRG